ncbi:MAG: TraB/GumN family protein [Bdellovibrionales bacterium]
MKKHIAAFLLAISTISAFADTGKLQNPYFFSAIKDGRVLYIFGVSHIGIAISEMPQFVMDALESSNTFAAEKIYSQEIKEKDSSPAYEVQAPTLATIELLVERGIPRSSIRALSSSPMMCEIYKNLEIYQQFVADGGKILDEQFEDMAVVAHKKLVQLDNSDMTSHALKSIAGDCFINELVQKLSPEKAKAIASQNRDINQYRAGEMSSIADADDPTDTALVAERNQVWIEIIDGIQEPTAFIVVGAGHLGGTRGMLNLLANKGYKISRYTGLGQSFPLILETTSAPQP